MKLEIEMKAHVSDRAAVEAALSRNATKVRDFSKSDAYYLFPGAQPGQGHTFRVRRDSSLEGASVVTWKERSKTGGLEVNREHEFAVPEPAELVALAEAMGAREYFTKRKAGSEWSSGPFRIELVEVPPLGTFLEIETVIDSRGEEEDRMAAEEGRRGIMEIFSSCGLSASDVEERYYSQMLRESGAMAWEPEAK